MLKNLFLIFIFSNISLSFAEERFLIDYLSENTNIYLHQDVIENPFYKIELIIFKQNNFNDNKKIKDNYELSYPSKMIFLNEINRDNDFNKIHIIKKTNLNNFIELDNFYLMEKNISNFSNLESITKKLNMAGHKILFHESWVQEILSKDLSLATPINGGEKIKNNYELQGFIKINKDRYFHLNANLWLSIFETNKKKLFTKDHINEKTISSLVEETGIELPLPPTDIEGDKLRSEIRLNKDINNYIENIVNEIFYLEITETITDLLTTNYDGEILIDSYNIDESEYIKIVNLHVLDQSKKISLGKPYYMDHPMLGLIIIIDKYEYDNKFN